MEKLTIYQRGEAREGNSVSRHRADVAVLGQDPRAIPEVPHEHRPLLHDGLQIPTKKAKGFPEIFQKAQELDPGSTAWWWDFCLHSPSASWKL